MNLKDKTKHIFLSTFLLLPVFNLHARQAPDHDALHYNIAIAVSESSDSMSGWTQTTLRTVLATRKLFCELILCS